MAESARLYGVKIIEEDEVPPTFVFYDQQGKVAEEVAMGNLTKEQMHQTLRSRGFNLIPGKM